MTKEAAVDLRPVDDTRGCPRGLTVQEQIAWSVALKHPLEDFAWPIDSSLAEAVSFECETAVHDIDGQREALVKRWVIEATDRQVASECMLQQAGLADCPLRRRIHHSFIGYLAKEIGHIDERLPGDLLCGFPLVGKMPPCLVEADVVPKKQSIQPVAKLVQERLKCNNKIIASLKPSEWSQELMDIYDKDHELGALGEARVLTKELSDTVHLARRIGVREQRESGWRTRAVDDMTEMQMNSTCEQADKAVNGSVVHLVWMILMFLGAGLHPLMWKRDISNAFRRLPVLKEHVCFAWVVWMHLGDILAAPHTGMPFGAVASVIAWHRVGAFLSTIIKKLAKAPLSRYVDDFFGASVQGVYWSGGRLLSILCTLTGLLCDSKKDENDSLSMIVLGLMVDVSLQQAQVLVRLEAKKAVQWRETVEEAMLSGQLFAWQAAKLAGRLQWALCASKSRAGGAYLKAVFAQAFEPLRGAAISTRLAQALEWVSRYLLERPSSSYSSINETRQHARTWTDASGVDRMVAAVLYADNRWKYTFVQVSTEFLESLLPRGDKYIGLLELLAPVLAIGTWPEEFVDRIWSAWIDNQGVLHSLVKGSSLSVEMNAIVGNLWLHLARVGTDLFVERVESAANLGDGPSRNCLDDLRLLGAEYTEPRWPPWSSCIWARS